MQDFICKYWNVVNVPDISSYIPLINLVCAFKLKIGYLMSQKANFYSLPSISVLLNKLLIYNLKLYCMYIVLYCIESRQSVWVLFIEVLGNILSLIVNPGVGFQRLISWGLRCLSRKFMSFMHFLMGGLA